MFRLWSPLKINKYYVQIVNVFFLHVQTVNAFFLFCSDCDCLFLVCSDCERLFLVFSDCERLFLVWLDCERLFCVYVFRLWTPTPQPSPLFFFLVWASALCTFYNNPAPLNGSMQFHYCTLVTSREPEQTTLLFWSATCGVTPHGLHTADRR